MGAKERSDLEELELNDEEQKMLAESDFPTGEEAPQEEAPQEAEPQQAEAPPPAEPVVPQIQERVVPLAALQEARRENREMRQRLQAVEDLKQQFIQMREQIKPKPVVPTYQEDPFAAIQHDIELLKQDAAQRSMIAAQMMQREVVEKQQTQFANYIVNDEMTLRQQVPDYEQAFNHLVGNTIAKFNTMGIHDPEDVMQRLKGYAQMITADAMKSGKSPSQVIYEMAKLEGYRGPAPQQATPQQTPPQDRPRDNQGRFAPVQQGIQANRTLQTGVATPKNPDVEALLNASDEDFKKMWGEFWGDEAKNTIL